ncbi:phosphoesterase [Metamycoplasma hyosynoviae]|uniref:DHH family phosphoesterase n=1 Tax=Metamycoplasma hyosynoviae TaxID=29559 RepID=UPI000460CA07|nr:DHHA1 domain-containing protein [Metamycoplasma hyosynoviae]KDE43040.1 phosphoesterase [Metamycoplasma hyosynoviae]
MNNLAKKFEEFWKILSQYEYITLCTHVEPDGDTLGSAIALQNLIKLNSKKCKEVKISGGDYPRNLSFIIDEPISLVSDEYFAKSLKIVVDTSTKSRIFDKRVVPQESLKLDHHPCEEKWLYEIGGDYWPAAGQVVANLAKTLKLKINQKAIEGMAMAIITDTSNFTERNISAETFEMMVYLMENKLNYAELIKNMQLNNDEINQIFEVCQNRKTEGLVTYAISEKVVTNDIVRPLIANFVSLSNSEVTLAVMKQVSGIYRCSIRSRSYYDVSEVARKFGGGGHKNSSGFKISSLDELLEVIKFINRK